MSDLSSELMTVLIVATLDTKGYEAIFLKDEIERNGCKAIIMDIGILESTPVKPDISRDEVAEIAGKKLKNLISAGDKGACIRAMMKGASKMAEKLYREGIFQGIIGIGGAQGTDIGTSAMRSLPFGVPKFMVSTVASGFATFGPYVGTKDIIMMHSVADIQGINRITREVMRNAAAAVCAMVKARNIREDTDKYAKTVGMSMLGTTTPGALRAKKLLEKSGYEVVAFHQNGTGGIAMEEMILEGMFCGVLDINLHEIADYVVGGLHRSIKPFRLENAGKIGLPQVIAPGSINYSVQGPFETLPEEIKKRKYIIHNPNLTLVRLSHSELDEAAKVVAGKLNKVRGKIHVFIPLRGFSFPDREGYPHWEPEGNRIFIKSLEANLNPSIPLTRIDAHINDREFIDPVVEKFKEMVGN